MYANLSCGHFRLNSKGERAAPLLRHREGSSLYSMKLMLYGIRAMMPSSSRAFIKEL